MNKILVVVDLGHFKAYRVSKSHAESPKIELLKSFDTIEAHGRLREKLSDEAGRFGLSGGKGGIMGYGEAHNMELEIRKKLIRQISEEINTLIRKERCSEWCLAAGKSINRQILENLDASVMGKLAKNIVSDLTKKHKTELLNYFKIV
jgi:hypothetical protein